MVESGPVVGGSRLRDRSVGGLDEAVGTEGILLEGGENVAHSEAADVRKAGDLGMGGHRLDDLAAGEAAGPHPVPSPAPSPSSGEGTGMSCLWTGSSGNSATSHAMPRIRRDTAERRRGWRPSCVPWAWPSGTEGLRISASCAGSSSVLATAARTGRVPAAWRRRLVK